MKRTLTALAAMVVTGSLVAAAPTTATAQPRPAPTDLPAGEVAAMQRDLGLSGDALRARLAVEAAAAKQEKTLRAELGAGFGGAWLNRQGTGLVVGVTAASSDGAVRAAGAQPQPVTHSLADLDALKSTLDKHSAAAGSGVRSWYADPATDSVVVEATSQAAGTAFARASGAQGVTVKVVDGSPAPRPLNDIRGGDEYQEIESDNELVLCSVGFSVSGGYVTAGHCGTAGDETGQNNFLMGHVMASTYPGHDWAWVQTVPGFVSQPVVNNYSGGTVPVDGATEAVVGASICHSGFGTGWHCGVITNKNASISYSGLVVNGLTTTSACGGPGDSGGAVISGDQAQGVISGGAGDCTNGGTTYYQPINPILANYNLKLVTSTNTSALKSVYAGRCIDVPNAAATDGTPLQIYDCNQTSAQQWTFADDGTLRSRGLCMDVTGGATAAGTLVQLATCNGTGAQQWVQSSTTALINPQSGKCLDVKDWNSANGGALQIWTCTGLNNQQWSRT